MISLEFELELELPFIARGFKHAIDTFVKSCSGLSKSIALISIPSQSASNSFSFSFSSSRPTLTSTSSSLSSSFTFSFFFSISFSFSFSFSPMLSLFLFLLVLFPLSSPLIIPLRKSSPKSIITSLNNRCRTAYTGLTCSSFSFSFSLFFAFSLFLHLTIIVGLCALDIVLLLLSDSVNDLLISLPFSNSISFIFAFSFSFSFDFVGDNGAVNDAETRSIFSVSINVADGCCLFICGDAIGDEKIQSILSLLLLLLFILFLFSLEPLSLGWVLINSFFNDRFENWFD